MQRFVSRHRALQALLATAALPVAATRAADSSSGPRARLSSAGHEALAWPSRPLRLVVGFPAGSVQDISARAIAPGLSRELGQPVIVENKIGASGAIAADYVSKASDAHTFGVMNNSQLTTARLLNPSVPYDPARDLTPIALIATTPLMLVVSGTAPGLSPLDVLNWLRALGDKGNYGSPGTGTPGHLGFELLKTRARLDTTHIPYKGNPDVITAIIGGQLQAGLMPPGLVLPHVRTGKLKVVGVTSESRSPLAPEDGTLRDVGVGGAEIELWSGLAGPKALPRAVVEKLGGTTIAVLKQDEIRRSLLTAGWQASPASGEGLRSRMDSDTRTFGAIITMRRIRVDG